jgi:DHA1 family tetracycline resistance protein-like MFS transporter
MLVTVLLDMLDMLGIGLIIPVWPKLVRTLYGSDISAGAFVFSWFAASYALMQFVFRPCWGI